jgi:putative NADPH-quinone reductase
MRVLVVYAHPCPESFTAAIRDRALASLAAAAHEARLVDLYAERFDPVLSADERRAYYTPGANEAGREEHLAALRWAEALVFVYPTWWYGPPAMIKGWLDRVWVPHATFRMPEGLKPLGRVLAEIRFLVVVTSMGSPRWHWWLVGMPGRRALFAGLSPLCAPRCRKLFLAHHDMDRSTPVAREAFLAEVERRLGSLVLR